MPGTTPRHVFPYPTDTDPIDVAGDMQALAEGVDTALIVKGYPTETALRANSPGAGIVGVTVDPADGPQNAPGSIWLNTPDQGWQRAFVRAWASGSFLGGPGVGNAQMTLTSYKNWAVQDTWGVRPLVDGTYMVMCNGMFNGMGTAPGQVVQLTLGHYTWANTSVPVASVVSFASPGTAASWTGVSVVGMFRMAAGDWIRIALGGDVAGASADNRSTYFITRVAP
jgi:hypothetical protein